jgi:hypothetical protein
MDTGDASRRRFGFVTRVNVRITETTFPLVRAYPRGLLVKPGTDGGHGLGPLDPRGSKCLL